MVREIRRQAQKNEELERKHSSNRSGVAASRPLAMTSISKHYGGLAH